MVISGNLVEVHHWEAGLRPYSNAATKCIPVTSVGRRVSWKYCLRGYGLGGELRFCDNRYVDVIVEQCMLQLSQLVGEAKCIGHQPVERRRSTDHCGVPADAVLSLSVLSAPSSVGSPLAAPAGCCRLGFGRSRYSHGRAYRGLGQKSGVVTRLRSVASIQILADIFPVCVVWMLLL